MAWIKHGPLDVTQISTKKEKISIQLFCTGIHQLTIIPLFIYTSNNKIVEIRQRKYHL